MATQAEPQRGRPPQRPTSRRVMREIPSRPNSPEDALFRHLEHLAAEDAIGAYQPNNNHKSSARGGTATSLPSRRRPSKQQLVLAAAATATTNRSATTAQGLGHVLWLRASGRFIPQWKHWPRGRRRQRQRPAGVGHRPRCRHASAVCGGNKGRFGELSLVVFKPFQR